MPLGLGQPPMSEKPPGVFGIKAPRSGQRLLIETVTYGPNAIGRPADWGRKIIVFQLSDWLLSRAVQSRHR
jgi:hypothetical protein